jgi:hypothetical protein
MRRTNLTCVIFDPDDPDPAKRFKALDNTGLRNFVGFYSADGLEWHEYEEKPLIPFGSELGKAVRDPDSGLYFAYIRPYTPRFYPKNVREKRLVAITTSSDFVSWSEPVNILLPDEIDDAWVVEEEQRTEFYSMAGFPYGSQFLGLLPVFRITEIYAEKEPRQSKYEGPIDVQLVHSRDGREWHRMEDRTPVIPTGSAGFDAGCIMDIASQPVILNDEILYYYTALSTTHGGKPPAKVASIGLARWRLDGFVSLEGDAAGGLVETTSWRASGGRLIVNADASRGILVVELIDPDTGGALPGYGLDDSIALHGDSVRHSVGWRNQVNLPDGVPFCIRFHLRDASIFSYRAER